MPLVGSNVPMLLFFQALHSGWAFSQSRMSRSMSRSFRSGDALKGLVELLLDSLEPLFQACLPFPRYVFCLKCLIRPADHPGPAAEYRGKGQDELNDFLVCYL